MYFNIVRKRIGDLYKFLKSIHQLSLTLNKEIAGCITYDPDEDIFDFHSQMFIGTPNSVSSEFKVSKHIMINYHTHLHPDDPPSGADIIEMIGHSDKVPIHMVISEKKVFIYEIKEDKKELFKKEFSNKTKNNSLIMRYFKIKLDVYSNLLFKKKITQKKYLKFLDKKGINMEIRSFTSG